MAALDFPSSPTIGQTYTANGKTWQWDGTSWLTANSGGDVVGPSSSTDNAVARFDGTTGKLIQNSAVTIADDGTTVISTSSSTDALRITQTGAGNALLVEDSTNPDSTPFAVDANGIVIVGNTTATNIYGFANQFQLLSTGNAYQVNAAFRNDAFAPFLTIAHSRNTSIGSHTVLQNGDQTGILAFAGSDGTAFIRTAQIFSEVDGTPGTNDMPGRLVFSTTADGASSPTERMRIDSAGRVGIGGTPGAGNTLKITKNITGTTVPYVVVSDGTIQSDATLAVSNYFSYLGTAAASFTLTYLNHYLAQQNTFGSTSTVTNQYGFVVDSSLTGATNNYGFYSNIASGTGRWNFYAAGTANNYFAGNVGIGSTAISGLNLRVSKPLTPGTDSGATDAYGIRADGQITSTATGIVRLYSTYPATQAATFNLTRIEHYSAAQDIFGVGSTVTNQYGFISSGGLISATNNYGFYSDIASGTGRWNFYAAGTAGNYFAGGVGIGTTNIGGFNGTVNLGGSGSPSSGYLEGWCNSQSIPSSVTTRFDAFFSVPSTAAASFILPELRHFTAQQGSFGAGSAVTSQLGFYADSGLTSATNNYGFYSNIASGTGRWNFYAAGTADNYFAGNVGIGAAPSGTKLLVSQGSAGTAIAALYSGSTGGGAEIKVSNGFSSTSPVYAFWYNNNTGIGNPATDTISFINNATERMRIDSLGNVAIGSSTVSGQALRIAKNITGSVASFGVYSEGQIQSDVTTAARYFATNATTAAASFTASFIQHFYAGQGTIGGTSAVTSQVGFFAESNLTGATNNYGFYSNIASGTGRWNFYAGGTADNYFAGNVGIGRAPSAKLDLAGYFRLGNYGGTYQGMSLQNNDDSSSAETVSYIDSQNNLATTDSHIFFFHQTSGGSAISFGTTPAGSRSTDRRLERMRIRSDGNIGIGSSGYSQVRFTVSGAIQGNVDSFGYYIDSPVASTVTSSAVYFGTYAYTSAASFTLDWLRHYQAVQTTLGAGSTINNQVGFYIDQTLVGAVNNYGVLSSIPSGTGRWNIYANGTASNYFAGNVGIGTTGGDFGRTIKLSVRNDQNATTQLVVTNATSGASAIAQVSKIGGTGNSFIDWALYDNSGAPYDSFNYGTAVQSVRWTLGGAERMRIDSSGNVGIGAAPSAGYLFGVYSNPTGATTTISSRVSGTIQSGVTSSHYGYYSDFTTQASTFTLSNLFYYSANQTTFGATSTVTSQYGFAAASSLVGATNNYGFYSNIASGTGRWNFYAADTANNAYKGSSSFGTITAPTALVMIAAGTATANTAPLKFTSGTNLTTPEAGVVEYDGTIISATTNTNFKRGTVEITNYASGTGTSLTAGSEATLQVLLPSANDTITLSVGTYFLDLCCTFTRGTTSTTSATARVNILGTGNAAGNFSGMAVSSATAASASSNFSFDAVNINTSNVVTAASTTASGVYTITLRGILKITTQGTIIPQYNLSANLTSAGTATAPKVLYLNLTQLDTQSAAAFGPAGTGWG